jgi:hypothetical protein
LRPPSPKGLSQSGRLIANPPTASQPRASGSGSGSGRLAAGPGPVPTSPGASSSPRLSRSGLGRQGSTQPAPDTLPTGDVQAQHRLSMQGQHMPPSGNAASQDPLQGNPGPPARGPVTLAPLHSSSGPQRRSSVSLPPLTSHGSGHLVPERTSASSGRLTSVPLLGPDGRPARPSGDFNASSSTSDVGAPPVPAHLSSLTLESTRGSNTRNVSSSLKVTSGGFHRVFASRSSVEHPQGGGLGSSGSWSLNGAPGGGPVGSDSSSTPPVLHPPSPLRPGVPLTRFGLAQALHSLVAAPSGSGNYGNAVAGLGVPPGGRPSVNGYSGGVPAGGGPLSSGTLSSANSSSNLNYPGHHPLSPGAAPPLGMGAPAARRASATNPGADTSLDGTSIPLQLPAPDPAAAEAEALEREQEERQSNRRQANSLLSEAGSLLKVQEVGVKAVTSTATTTAPVKAPVAAASSLDAIMSSWETNPANSNSSTTTGCAANAWKTPAPALASQASSAAEPAPAAAPAVAIAAAVQIETTGSSVAAALAEMKRDIARRMEEAARVSAAAAAARAQAASGQVQAGSQLNISGATPEQGSGSITPPDSQTRQLQPQHSLMATSSVPTSSVQAVLSQAPAVQQPVIVPVPPPGDPPVSPFRAALLQAQAQAASSQPPAGAAAGVDQAATTQGPGAVAATQQAQSLPQSIAADAAGDALSSLVAAKSSNPSLSSSLGVAADVASVAARLRQKYLSLPVLRDPALRGVIDCGVRLGWLLEFAATVDKSECVEVKQGRVCSGAG